MSWKAARSSTKVEFEKQLNEIKKRSKDAFKYLSAIPPRHWSRHAFNSQCKSDMLLNNLCETFNSVLKDARDKPILTHMEWMRRYVMQRMCSKKEAVEAQEDPLMPFAREHLKWAMDESRYCLMKRSAIDVYEVDYKQHRVVVNLKEKTCTCYNWDLSGLPCPHAVSCISLQREKVEKYVHEAYTKAKYLAAYSPIISPIRDSSEWERTGRPEPLPPLDKKRPGRPSSKKRKKEVGEA